MGRPGRRGGNNERASAARPTLLSTAFRHVPDVGATYELPPPPSRSLVVYTYTQSKRRGPVIDPMMFGGGRVRHSKQKKMNPLDTEIPFRRSALE